MVVQVLAHSGKRGAVGTVRLFRIQVDRGGGLARYHIGDAARVLDGSVAAQESLSQSVVAVVEDRLPQHHQVVGVVESDSNGIRHLAAIFLGKNATGHVSRSWEIKIQRRGDPGNLVNHVLGDIASGDLPEQTPVDQLVTSKLSPPPSDQN